MPLTTATASVTLYGGEMTGQHMLANTRWLDKYCVPNRPAGQVLCPNVDKNCVRRRRNSLIFNGTVDTFCVRHQSVVWDSEFVKISLFTVKLSFAAEPLFLQRSVVILPGKEAKEGRWLRHEMKGWFHAGWPESSAPGPAGRRPPVHRVRWRDSLPRTCRISRARP